MADKAYEYMDWPRIEAIVYGEEASPRDVMQPMVTADGVLIQGFFSGNGCCRSSCRENELSYDPGR